MQASTTRIALADLITERKDELVDTWAALLTADANSHYRDRAPAEVHAWAVAGVDALVASLRDGSWAPIERHAHVISRQRGRQGFEIGEVAGGLVLFKEALTATAIERWSHDPATLTAQLLLLAEALRRLVTHFTGSFADEMVRETRSRTRLIEALLGKGELLEILEIVCRETRKLANAAGSATLLEDDAGLLGLAYRDGVLPPGVEQCVAQLCRVSDPPALPTQPVTIDDLGELCHLEVAPRTALLLLPLRLQNQSVGALVLVRSHAPFSHDDVAAIGSFADQSAVAIEHARLDQQSRRVVALEERQRLARELHDSVTQSLYGLSLSVAAAQRLLSSGQLDAAGEALDRARDGALMALREMRLLIYDLRPALLEPYGLIPAIRSRLSAVEQRAGIATEFDYHEVGRLPARIEDAVYGVAVEALNNALKHARASRLRVELREQPTRHVVLTVTDDGVGFDPHADARAAGLGLGGMRERAHAVNAELTIRSRAGHGTSIELRVPPSALRASATLAEPAASEGEPP